MHVLKMTAMSSAQSTYLVGMTNWNFGSEMNKKYFFRAIGGVPSLSQPFPPRNVCYPGYRMANKNITHHLR